MAQLKDLIVNGATRLIGKLTTQEAQIQILDAPETSGSSIFGPGIDGQVLKTNGSSVYWDNHTPSNLRDKKILIIHDTYTHAKEIYNAQGTIIGNKITDPSNSDSGPSIPNFDGKKNSEITLKVTNAPSSATTLSVETIEVVNNANVVTGDLDIKINSTTNIGANAWAAGDIIKLKLIKPSSDYTGAYWLFEGVGNPGWADYLEEKYGAQCDCVCVGGRDDESAYYSKANKNSIKASDMKVEETIDDIKVTHNGNLIIRELRKYLALNNKIDETYDYIFLCLGQCDYCMQSPVGLYEEFGDKARPSFVAGLTHVLTALNSLYTASHVYIFTPIANATALATIGWHNNQYCYGMGTFLGDNEAHVSSTTTLKVRTADVIDLFGIAPGMTLNVYKNINSYRDNFLDAEGKYQRDYAYQIEKIEIDSTDGQYSNITIKDPGSSKRPTIYNEKDTTLNSNQKWGEFNTNLGTYDFVYWSVIFTGSNEDAAAQPIYALIMKKAAYHYGASILDGQSFNNISPWQYLLKSEVVDTFWPYPFDGCVPNSKACEDIADYINAQVKSNSYAYEQNAIICDAQPVMYKRPFVDSCQMLVEGNYTNKYGKNGQGKDITLMTGEKGDQATTTTYYSFLIFNSSSREYNSIPGVVEERIYLDRTKMNTIEYVDSLGSIQSPDSSKIYCENSTLKTYKYSNSQFVQQKDHVLKTPGLFYCYDKAYEDTIKGTYKLMKIDDKELHIFKSLNLEDSSYNAYFYDGDFYKNNTHTTRVAKKNNALYIDFTYGIMARWKTFDGKLESSDGYWKFFIGFGDNYCRWTLDTHGGRIHMRQTREKKKYLWNRSSANYTIPLKAINWRICTLHTPVNYSGTATRGVVSLPVPIGYNTATSIRRGYFNVVGNVLFDKTYLQYNVPITGQPERKINGSTISIPDGSVMNFALEATTYNTVGAQS